MTRNSFLSLFSLALALLGLAGQAFGAMPVTGGRRALLIYNGDSATDADTAFIGTTGVYDLLTSGGAYGGTGFNFTVDIANIPMATNTGSTWATAPHCVQDYAPRTITAQNYCLVIDLRFTNLNYNDGKTGIPYIGANYIAGDTITQKDVATYEAYLASGGGLLVVGDNFWDPSDPTMSAGGTADGFISREETMPNFINAVAATGMGANTNIQVGPIISNPATNAVATGTNPFFIETNYNPLLTEPTTTDYSGPLVAWGSGSPFAWMTGEANVQAVGVAWQGPALSGTNQAGRLVYWGDWSTIHNLATAGGLPANDMEYWLENIVTFLFADTCCSPPATLCGTGPDVIDNTGNPVIDCFDSSAGAYTGGTWQAGPGDYNGSGGFLRDTTTVWTDKALFSVSFPADELAVYSQICFAFRQSGTSPLHLQLWNGSYTTQISAPVTIPVGAGWSYQCLALNGLAATTNVINFETVDAPGVSISYDLDAVELMDSCGSGAMVVDGACCSVVSPTDTPTSTSSPTSTGTRSPTPTGTRTLTATTTLTATPTDTASATPSVTLTATPCVTLSATPTASPTRSATPSFSPTPTPSATPSQTLTATETDTFGPSPTLSASPSASPTVSQTQTWTATPTRTATPTATPTATQSQTWTATPTLTASPTGTPTVTQSQTWTATPTLTASPTGTPTVTQSQTWSGTPTLTASPSGTPTVTQSQTWSGTPTLTASPTATLTATQTQTWTATPTLSASPSQTATYSGTPSATVTPSPSPSGTVTPSFTVSPTVTVSPTITQTPQPVPVRLSVTLFNSAGEAVAVLFQGSAAFIPPGLGLSSPLLVEGQAGVELQLGTELANGQTGIPWNGVNNNGQLVSGGVYYFQVQYTDAYGHVTTYTKGLQVISAAGGQGVTVYNSAGELVWSAPLPAGSAGTLSLNASTLALAYSPGTGALLEPLVIQTGPGAGVTWNGRSSQGLPVQSGTYTVQVVTESQGGTVSVLSKSFTLLGTTVGAPSAAVTVAPNPLRAGQDLVVVYQTSPGCQGACGLYDLAGELVAKGLDTGASGRVVLAPGRLAGGVYVLAFTQLRQGAVVVRSLTKVAVLR